MSVKRSDFEVFEALAKDIEEGGNNEQREYSMVCKFFYVRCLVNKSMKLF